MGSDGAGRKTHEMTMRAAGKALLVSNPNIRQHEDKVI
jgi:hypothetical protein